MIHLIGPLSLWERGGATPPVPDQGGARPTGGYERDALVRWLLQPRQDRFRETLEEPPTPKRTARIAEIADYEGLEWSVAEIIAAHDNAYAMRMAAIEAQRAAEAAREQELAEHYAALAQALEARQALIARRNKAIAALLLASM